MSKPRGKSHTSLTETAEQVVRVLESISGIKMIAPGEITNTRSANTGKRFVTAVYTAAGMELIVTGQSTQKISVHTTGDPATVFEQLSTHKRLRAFTCRARERKI